MTIAAAITLLLLAQAEYPSLEIVRRLELVKREVAAEVRPLLLTVQHVDTGEKCHIVGRPVRRIKEFRIQEASNRRGYTSSHRPLDIRSLRRGTEFDLTDLTHCDVPRPSRGKLRVKCFADAPRSECIQIWDDWYSLVDIRPVSPETTPQFLPTIPKRIAVRIKRVRPTPRRPNRAYLVWRSLDDNDQQEYVWPIPNRTLNNDWNERQVVRVDEYVTGTNERPVLRFDYFKQGLSMSVIGPLPVRRELTVGHLFLDKEGHPRFVTGNDGSVNGGQHENWNLPAGRFDERGGVTPIKLPKIEFVPVAVKNPRGTHEETRPAKVFFKFGPGEDDAMLLWNIPAPIGSIGFGSSEAELRKQRKMFTRLRRGNFVGDFHLTTTDEDEDLLVVYDKDGKPVAIEFLGDYREVDRVRAEYRAYLENNKGAP